MLLKFGLFVMTVMVIIYLSRFILSKTLNIRKEKKGPIFSYNHINKLHGKIDWGMRIAFIIIYPFLSYHFIYDNLSLGRFILVLVIYIVLDYSVRAFFEWKYSENPKQSIITVVEMLIIVFSTAIVFQFYIVNIS
ncbi:hypothetical protein FIU87_13095 [Bacillus sp. THAF10]|uniref:DUF4181 domain-containing protein n=1 Tax=Bacillus sp. THAF10 TaxID=2587848 RepID=UPI0012692F1C|nr:DUF4181 domain-containing protein [Bacillus sp. THAF10]QFT89590.1 hypothetical protein FIU87_13095 [Bacillus sp. THAF10]